MSEKFVLSILRKLIKLWTEFNNISCDTRRRVELRQEMRLTMEEAKRLVEDEKFTPEEPETAQESLYRLKGNFYE
jgi:hypothetical protein